MTARSLESGAPLGERAATPSLWSRIWQKDAPGYLFLLPWLIGFLIFTAGAMLFSLGLTVFETDFLTGFRFVGTQNFARMIEDRLFVKSLGVTFYYVALAVPSQVLIALAIALLLNNSKVAFTGVWRTLYFLPSIVSGIAVSLLWIWIFNPDSGLLNYGLGLIGIKGPRWIYSEQWAVPSLAIISAFNADPHILFTVVAGTFSGTPAPSAAWRAGA